MQGSGIYQILNTTNGKRYVGSAVDLQRRQQDHWSMFEREDHNNSYLQRAWNKYGEKSFSFKIIEYISNPKQLIKREQYYFDTLKPEYNLSLTAGSNLGYRHTPKTRKNMSKAQMGNQHSLGYKHTLETREKYRKTSMGNKNALGYKHTEETLQKLQGENNHTAKLTEPKVRKIRLELVKGRTLLEIANMFEVSERAIRSIRTRRTWKHIK